MGRFTKEHKEKLRKAHLGVKLSPEHRENVVKALRKNAIKKGQTYEEAFGVKIARRMKEKMRQAKLGKKMPWNSILSKKRKGIFSNRWIKDRTKVKLDKERGGPLHKHWSRSVKNRDNWNCKLADKNCSGRVIAHHIFPWSSHPKLRYEITNGITLCHFHHPRRRTDEKRLRSLFLELIKSN